MKTQDEKTQDEKTQDEQRQGTVDRLFILAMQDAVESHAATGDDIAMAGLRVACTGSLDFYEPPQDREDFLKLAGYIYDCAVEAREGRTN